MIEFNHYEFLELGEKAQEDAFFLMLKDSTEPHRDQWRLGVKILKARHAKQVEMMSHPCSETQAEIEEIEALQVPLRRAINRLKNGDDWLEKARANYVRMMGHYAVKDPYKDGGYGKRRR